MAHGSHLPTCAFEDTYAHAQLFDTGEKMFLLKTWYNKNTMFTIMAEEELCVCIKSDDTTV